VHRAKLFVVLRLARLVLFTKAFQAEVAALLYEDHPKGHLPISTTQLALASGSSRTTATGI
jgi:hypothetical protein